MIELAQGRSVKWQHNGAWFTGYLLMDDICVVEAIVGSDDAHLLVRHSNTSAVFIVKASELQDNDFRPLETEMLRIIDILKKAYNHAEDDAKQFVPYEGAKELLANFLNGKATAEEVQEFIEECDYECAVENDRCQNCGCGVISDDEGRRIAWGCSCKAEVTESEAANELP